MFSDKVRIWAAEQEHIEGLIKTAGCERKIRGTENAERKFEGCRLQGGPKIAVLALLCGRRNRPHCECCPSVRLPVLYELKTRKHSEREQN